MTEQRNSVGRVDERLRLLERQLQSQRYVTLVALSLLAILLVFERSAVAQSRRNAQTLVAQKIILTDPQGRPRIVLDVMNELLGSGGHERSETFQKGVRPALSILDDAGRARLQLRVGADNVPSLVLSGPKDGGVARLVADPSPILALQSSSGDIATLGATRPSGASLDVTSGRSQITLAARSDGTQYLRFSKEARLRLALGEVPLDVAQRWRLPERGVSSLLLIDEAGSVARALP